MQGRVLLLVHRGQVAVRLQQLAEDLLALVALAERDGVVERRALAAVPRVDLLANRDEVLHSLYVTVPRRVVQGLNLGGGSSLGGDDTAGDVHGDGPADSLADGFLAAELIVELFEKRGVVGVLHHGGRAVLLDVVEELLEVGVVLQSTDPALHVGVLFLWKRGKDGQRESRRLEDSGTGFRDYPIFVESGAV